MASGSRGGLLKLDLLILAYVLAHTVHEPYTDDHLSEMLEAMCRLKQFAAQEDTKRHGVTPCLLPWRAAPKSIKAYLDAHGRNQAMVKACREGAYAKCHCAGSGFIGIKGEPDNQRLGGYGKRQGVTLFFSFAAGPRLLASAPKQALLKIPIARLQLLDALLSAASLLAPRSCWTL